jgi:hypothetical protein
VIEIVSIRLLGKDGASQMRPLPIREAIQMKQDKQDKIAAKTAQNCIFENFTQSLLEPLFMRFSE